MEILREAKTNATTHRIPTSAHFIPLTDARPPGLPNSPLDPDNKVNLALGRNVKVTRLPSLSLQPDLLLLLVSVLLDVLVSSLEDDLSLGLSLLNEASIERERGRRETSQ